MLTIFNRLGQPKLTVEPSESDSHSHEIQGDNMLSLSFTLTEAHTINVGDYVEWEGARFLAMERTTPAEVSSVEWKYALKFYGIESLIKRFLVLYPSGEPTFTLTGKAVEHVRLIVAAINAALGGTNWKVGRVDDTAILVIDYDGTYCDEALRKVAEAAKTEWWVEGSTINLTRCEQGEVKTLAYGRGLVSLDAAKADNVKFYTRLYPIGSDRNIVTAKYGAQRLQLPGGAKYVETAEVNTYGVIDHYERDAFADIYPRRIGTVSAVRSEKRKVDGKEMWVFYFSDAGLDFDPNTLEIPGETKRITFQDGSELAGREFECNYNTVRKEFELITKWINDGKTQLPNSVLTPKVGDKYILWNIRMPESYVRAAEVEFRQAVEKYNAEHARDISVYKARTDFEYLMRNPVPLSIGQRVRLESSEFFTTGYRVSRITKVSQRLALPTWADIEMSEAISKGTMQKIGDSVKNVEQAVKRVQSTLPDLITTGDSTQPTDSNIFSALRTMQDFPMRKKDERILGRFAFENGLTFGQTPMYYVDDQGRTHLRTLTIDEHLEVPELRYNRTSVHIGYTLQSPAAGIILRVEKTSDIAGKVFLKLEEGELGTVEVGDLLTGIFHATTAQGGATTDTDDGKLNLTFAGFATAFFEVEEIDPARKWFTYVLRSGTTFHPQPHMTFAGRGNKTEADRQAFVVYTRTYTRYLRDVADWEIEAKHVAMQQGELDNLHKLGFSEEIKGVGMFADNVFLTGKLLIDNKLRDVGEVVGKLEQKITEQAVYLQYSVDGVNAWHDVATSADRFMRQRKGNGAWSAALPFGRDGRDGAKGDPGTPGRDGQDGRPGKDGRDGAKGDPGAPGKNGRDGKSYTPNLIDNSAFTKDLEKWWKNYPQAGITLDDSVPSPVVGTRVLKILPNGGDHIYLATTIGKVLRPNTTYTFSVWSKQPAKASAAVFYVYGSAGQWEHIFGADGSWQRFTKTFTTPAEVKPDTTLCLLNFKNPDPNYIVYFAAPKLEEGSTATAWTSSEADRKGTDGKPGQNGLPGKDGADGRSSYTHVRYSADGGQTFTAATAEAIEAAKKLRGAGVNLASTLHPAVDYIQPWRPNVSAQTSLLSQSELPIGAFRGVKVIQPKPAHGIFHFNGLGYAGGKHYTMSFWAKADAAHTLEFGPEVYGSAGLIFHHVTLSTEWTFYQHTFFLFGDANCSLVLFGKAAGTYYYADVKFEEGDVATPWTPCALDAAVGTTPARYRGELVSDQPVASLNPRVYTWVDTKGEKGNPGTPGVGVQEVVAEFATGDAAAPKSGWSTSLPAWTKGQYLWRRERITYTDGRVERTPQQRDDTWAHIGQLTDQANAATSTANSAKQTAENAYNEAVSDKKVTAAEQRAIIRARVESLKSEVYAEKARLEVQYTKVRLYQHLTPDLSSRLMNLNTTFKGTGDDLLNACTNYLQSSPFKATDDDYINAINPPGKKYYDKYIAARDALNAALAESGSFEIGGRNLFGFRKGVWLEVLGGGLEAVLAPDIRGVRIRCTGEVQEGWGVRIRNLGFERPGYYTASATLVAGGRAQGMMMADLCDQSVVGVALSASGKRMELSGRLNHYTTKADYNGFLDIACARQTELFPGDLIELRDLMIERGGVASTWCKAEEDVEWELANTEYLRTAFEQRAGIDGGIVFGALLQMRDTDNRVTAYLNGLRSKNRDGFIRAALALGVSNFAEAGESAQTELHFNGSGHIGRLNVREDGKLSLEGEGESMMEFSPVPMDIPGLVKSTDFTVALSLDVPTATANGELSNGEYRVRKNITIGRLKVEREFGVLQGTLKVKVTPETYLGGWTISPQGVGYRRNRLLLRQAGVCEFELLTDLASGGGLAEYNLPLTLVNLPKGDYTLDIEFYCDQMKSCTFEVSQAAPVRYVSTNARRFNAVRSNGFVSYYSPSRHVYIQDGVLHAKSVPDMPGVLVAGTASGNNGYSSDYWGCKGNIQAKTAREAVGIYRINHYIGHIGYSVMITPIHSGRNLVATILRKEKGYVQFVIREAHTAAQVDADFDFTILGRN